MFASEVFLGVRPAAHVTFCVIASPAGSYFPGGRQAGVDLAVAGLHPGRARRHRRGQVRRQLRREPGRPAGGGGQNGCAQVAFLDAIERRWVEELGGMNLFFVRADGSIVTPELTDSILEGVTRDSVLTLLASRAQGARSSGSTIDDWRGGVASGEITEVFACGTAAVVTPVGTLRWSGRRGRQRRGRRWRGRPP